MLSISSIKGDAGYYSHEDNYYASGSLDSRWMGGGPHSYCLSAGYALTEHGRALCFPPVCAGLWLQHSG